MVFRNHYVYIKLINLSPWVFFHVHFLWLNIQNHIWRIVFCINVFKLVVDPTIIFWFNQEKWSRCGQKIKRWKFDVCLRNTAPQRKGVSDKLCHCQMSCELSFSFVNRCVESFEFVGANFWGLWGFGNYGVLAFFCEDVISWIHQVSN